MATNGQSPAPCRLIYSEAESSATSNSLPPTMRSKTSRPDLSVRQLSSTPSTATSPSRMASNRSYRQLAKVKESWDTGRWRPMTERRSAFGELERTPRFGLAVFLALDHARIARQEAAMLEGPAQVGFIAHQGLGKTVAHRARLARQAAARHRAHDIE